MSLFLPYSEALCGGGHLRLCMKECSLLYAGGRYVLPPLPYAESALEPVLDAETLCLHHDRHHAAYVAGANAALERLHAVAEGEILLYGSGARPSTPEIASGNDYLPAIEEETVRRRRPLARRRASTLRPSAVDILSRKPCLITLFLFEGWNVLFIAL